MVTIPRCGTVLVKNRTAPLQGEQKEATRCKMPHELAVCCTYNARTFDGAQPTSSSYALPVTYVLRIFVHS